MDKELPQCAKSKVETADPKRAKLRTDNEELYQKMISDVDRNPLWGEKPRQPIARCVAHVCAILVFQIEEALGGGNSGDLSEAEANRWAKKNGTQK